MASNSTVTLETVTREWIHDHLGVAYRGQPVWCYQLKKAACKHEQDEEQMRIRFVTNREIFTQPADDWQPCAKTAPAIAMYTTFHVSNYERFTPSLGEVMGQLPPDVADALVAGKCAVTSEFIAEQDYARIHQAVTRVYTFVTPQPLVVARPTMPFHQDEAI